MLQGSGALDPLDKDQREESFDVDHQMWRRADLIAFYVDFGLSLDMHAALDWSRQMKRKERQEGLLIEQRRLYQYRTLSTTELRSF